MRFVYCFAAAASLLSVSARADTALQSGTGVSIPLPAVQPAPTNYYIDVDNTAKQLNVTIAGNSGDVDLFVRYGSPFPLQDALTAPPQVAWDLLNRNSQYHSVSSSPNESIRILPSGHFPLRAGRWYIAAINGTSAATTTTLTATTSTAAALGNMALDFLHPRTGSSDPTNDCDDSFWTDSTPATPVGGNTGTTLGQQRKNALTYAAQQLVQQLQIPVTVNTHACGAHLGGDSTSAILAHAGPTTYLFDEPKFPMNAAARKYTWYPAAALARLNGTSMCGLAGGGCDGTDSSGTPNNQEIEITFNADIGQSSVIGGEKFYLGFDADQSSSSIDFITIAMHEMTHGLGFFGLANSDSGIGPLGAKAGIDTQQNTIAYENVDDGPYDDIYDDNVAEVNGSAYTPFMGYEVNGSGDAGRAAALVSGPVVTSAGTYNPGVYTGLRWFDAAAVNSSVNIHHEEAAPNDFLSLYAPCDKSKTTTCATQPSSTLSHTVQAGDMMNAYYSRFNLRQMGLAVPMLGAIGWSNAAAAAPQLAQPIPSNWYDPKHNGHGFDFELGYHDAVLGDVYFLIFYTYTAAGVPEWYQAVGHLVDGVFMPLPDTNGNTLSRVVYASNAQGGLHVSADPNVTGSLVVDFNQAANSPVCRNMDRSQVDMLGVLYWTIGGESGYWCMQPIVPLAAHASPDYNGHWYAASDPGWGFELLDVTAAPGANGPTIVAIMYYPGPNNQPAWAQATGTLVGNTAAMQLLAVDNGYCRGCTPPATLSGQTIGTMTLTLDAVATGAYPTGHATVQASYPGGGAFSRTNIPIVMLSVPTGQ